MQAAQQNYLKNNLQPAEKFISSNKDSNWPASL